MSADIQVLVGAGAFAVLLALVSWRGAFGFVLLAGFIQDPLRKLIPDRPVTMVMLAVVVFAAAFVGASLRHGSFNLGPFVAGDRGGRKVLVAFIAIVLVQAVLALFRFGSPIIAMIGVLTYLAPFAATWLAHRYARKPLDITRMFTAYCLFATIAAATVIASYNGAASPLFDVIGGQELIFNRAGGAVLPYSGLMRTPEIAAWHCAAGLCLASVLASTYPTFRSRVFSLLVAGVALYAAVLTGRRKVVALMLLFQVFYWVTLFYWSRNHGRRLRFVVISAVILLMILLWLVWAPERSEFSAHFVRSSTIFEDALDRLWVLGVLSIYWAWQVGGFFGFGAGAGAQGTQYFRTEEFVGMGAAEGGLGRIATELGFPGLVLAIWSITVVVRRVRAILRDLNRNDPQLFRLTLGMVCFLAANAPVFAGASQVYGDPFVLILLGTVLGFVLAMPRLLTLRQAREQARQLGIVV